ncbi:uncharacterized protein LOC122640247 [Telopea speciosissima]|uniref:uncharacterized protein LOC122640247 n=1 Tax=Telopea speciosissima TaxID=54955 RepID=UPI001CC5A542|nr:uncharacterized protein LOC122640247 [Telopea speciosissima]
MDGTPLPLTPLPPVFIDPGGTSVESDGSEEEDTFTIDDELEDKIAYNESLTLAGYVFPGRRYRKQAVTEALINVWNTSSPVQVSSFVLIRTYSNSDMGLHPWMLEIFGTTGGNEVPWMELSRAGETLDSPFFVSSPQDGKPRGLALLWKKNVNLSTLSTDTNFIDTEVGMKDIPSFYVTCVYGDPVKHKRKNVWDRIAALNHQGSKWVCFGDFNSYLAWHEKEGGSKSSAHNGELFNDFLQACGFMDMGVNGPRFTWNNKRQGAANIRIRLDRSLCNSAWRQAFENASVLIKPTISSDHCSIMVDTEGGRVRGRRPFRFESMWTFHADFRNVASKAWSIPTTGPVVKQLEQVQDLPHSIYSQEKESELRSLLEAELKKEEELWRQKSKSLYYSEPINNNALDLVLGAVQPIVSEDLNNILCSVPQMKEIRDALFKMAPLKSPCPDGLSPVFYQKYWDLVKDDLLALVVEFSTTGVIPRELNKTFIYLIPKIISPAQSAFIPDRLISDNILVAHELFHYIKKQKKGKGKFLALKLDMRKGAISPSRGIRQGDLISPAIFILCSQALTAVIDQAKSAGLLKGVRVHNRGDLITHLLFADDCLLFAKVDLQEINYLKECLDLYCKATGQAINLQKSSLTFNPNTHDRIKRWFSRILKVKHGDGPTTYLGLPTHFGVSKKDVFNDIKEKTLSKLQGWKEKLLSHAGKELLLKAAVVPMANYASSHFKLLVSFHDSIRKASSRFFWGGEEETQKIHWMSWQRLCRPKSRGGLGLKDSKIQNKALLAKAKVGNRPSWGWRSILVGREVLLEGLVWKIGDGSSINIWEDRWIPSLPNFKLQSSKPSDCSLSVVGDLIEPISQTWRSDLLNLILQPAEVKAISQIPLSLFVGEDKQCWATSKNGYFSVKLAYCMLARKEEEASWAKASSSRSRSWEHIDDSVWNRIWSIHTMPKVRSFLWRATNEALATGFSLHARQVRADPSCGRCGAPSESGDHILFDSPFARSVWFGSPLQFSPPSVDLRLVDWLKGWETWFRQDKKVAHDSLSKASFIYWYLWRARNDLIFSGKERTPLEVIQAANKAFLEFSSANPVLSSSPFSGSVGLSRLGTWVPPPVGVIKANSDAALPADKSKGGVGVVFRDHSGSPCLARSIPSSFGCSIQGELLAIRYALTSALELGIDDLMVETDNMDAFLMVEGKKIPSWEVADLVVEVERLVPSFSSVVFSCVPRALNMVADALARKALSLVCATDWPYSIQWLHELWMDNQSIEDQLLPAYIPNNLCATVADIIEDGNWALPQVEDRVLQGVFNKILYSNIMPLGREDARFWANTKSRTFTVSSAWEALRQKSTKSSGLGQSGLSNFTLVIPYLAGD